MRADQNEFTEDLRAMGEGLKALIEG